MNRILFPTDFSKASLHAFIYALKIANQFGASITVLHVYNLVEALDIYSTGGYMELYEQLKAKKFANYQDSILPLIQIAKENQLEHVEQAHVLQEGLVVDVILEVAKRDNIDMIVLGTTGASGLKEVFLGSVAGEILENAPCPTLAVPKNADFDQKIDTIAFTTAYQQEDEVALRFLLNWSETLNATIQVVNVDLAHTEFYLNQMQEYKEKFAGNDRLNFKVLDGNSFVKTLSDHLVAEGIDLLTMITHKRNILEELFRSSRAKMMSYHTKIPIMSIPASLLT